MDVFTLDLATLPNGSSPLVLEAKPDQLGLDPGVWAETIQGRVRIEKNGDQVSVRGDLEAVARVECVRCLKAVELVIQAPFELYAKRTSHRRGDEDDEFESDDFILFHDGRRLDLREQARETLLLEVPMAPYCRPDCRGLCPRCGADLNLGPHVCEGEPKNET